MPATTSMPASDVIASLPMKLPSRTTTTAASTPVRTFAHRDWAPPLTSSAVPPSEPPAGRPWNRAPATLAAPWPTKSREVSG